MLDTTCCVLLEFCADVLDMYEAWHSSSYRQKAIAMIYEHICADDTASHGISTGPVRMSHGISTGPVRVTRHHQLCVLLFLCCSTAEVVKCIR